MGRASSSSSSSSSSSGATSGSSSSSSPLSSSSESPRRTPTALRATKSFALPRKTIAEEEDEEELPTDVPSLHARIKELKADLVTAEKAKARDVRRVRKELMDKAKDLIKKEKKRLSNELSTLGKEKYMLEGQVEELEAKLGIEGERDISHLHEGCRNELNMSKEENARLTMQLGQLNQQVESLSTAKSAATARIESLQQRNDALKEQVAAARESLREKQVEHRAKVQEVREQARTEMKEARSAHLRRFSTGSIADSVNRGATGLGAQGSDGAAGDSEEDSDDSDHEVLKIEALLEEHLVHADGKAAERDDALRDAQEENRRLRLALVRATHGDLSDAETMLSEDRNGGGKKDDGDETKGGGGGGGGNGKAAATANIDPQLQLVYFERSISVQLQNVEKLVEANTRALVSHAEELASRTSRRRASASSSPRNSSGSLDGSPRRKTDRSLGPTKE